MKPMVVYPYDIEQNNPEMIGHGEPSPTPLKIDDKQTKILKIALKLAKINSFNDDLNIRKQDGTYNANSNVARLLALTQNRVRHVSGMPDLIRELFVAKIDPDLIINEMVKSRLIELYSKTNPPPNEPPYSPQRSRSPSPPPSQPPAVPSAPPPSPERDIESEISLPSSPVNLRQLPNNPRSPSPPPLLGPFYPENKSPENTEPKKLFTFKSKSKENTETQPSSNLAPHYIRYHRKDRPSNIEPEHSPAKRSRNKPWEIPFEDESNDSWT